MGTKRKATLLRKEKRRKSHFDAQLAEAVLLLSKNRFLLVSGPLFSGRSTLAKDIAKCYEPELSTVIISFDDQMDSKTLFGCYQSSGIPGDFVWESSAFLDAVTTEGTLLIIKSWETANSDTQNAVVKLARDGFIMLPGERKIVMSSTTRIIGIVLDSAPVNKELSFPLVITCPPLTKHDIIERLAGCVVHGIKLDQLYDVYIQIKQHIDTLPYTERRLTTRDFYLMCSRLNGKSLTVTDVYLDLSDVFIGHLCKLAHKERPLQVISSFLSMANNSVDYIEKERNVELKLTKDEFVVGRVALEVRKHNVSLTNSLPFAPTRCYRMLMEKIAKCVENKEFVLLNGETGIGKTRVVQELANRINVKLESVNLSLDSEAVDIIGGYKPVNVGVIIRQLVGSLCLAIDLTEDLKQRLMELLSKKKYKAFLRTISKSVEYLLTTASEERFLVLSKLLTKIEQLSMFLASKSSNTPFNYAIGVLTRAMNDGCWLLLDEINMGTNECLNALASIVTEKGASAHPDFRLFACMNPATDTGKKKLPVNVRAIFTEFFVNTPRDEAEICEIINQYLATSKTQELAKYYLNFIDKNPHKFSLRNLCRALLLAKDDVFRSFEKSMEMALRLGFNDENEENWKLIQIPQNKSLGDQQKNFVLVEGVYFPRGPHLVQEDSDYIRTESVQKYIQAIAAAVASGRFPVLLEGETSTGKTSVISHLAKVTGYTVHRINNHEQTDVQEYIGSYVPNKDNKLQFQEGLLLKAVRNGDWVILDELNLAPTEVLEALNRLLDDNRELVVPEYDICVKAHPNFRIFATQNPAGLYGGRKKLSRAFLNRFVVINFVQPPKGELVQIVSRRCGIAESSAKLMVQVMLELKVRRSNNAIFNTNGLMTLRDLFRWGNRLQKAEESREWRQELANQGYFLLASRCRSQEDSLRIQTILETCLKRTINVEELFSISSYYFPGSMKQNCTEKDGVTVLYDYMVLTPSLIKMIILFNEGLKSNEPLLLVGETGCGKTSVTYLMANNKLEFINCHERTDVSDLLGSIRPTSDGLFQWHDGVVTRAMKTGSLLLIDEISLAFDSVLERLNSMLEPSRTILLADSGASSEVVTAVSGFQCVATMNPGGDYGKKELSKALRNRFTEIWCVFGGDEQEVLSILRARLLKELTTEQTDLELITRFLARFLVSFFKENSKFLRHKLCARDVVVVAEMMTNFIKSTELSLAEALYHTISSAILDSLSHICNSYHTNSVGQLTEAGKTLFSRLYKELSSESISLDTFEDLSVQIRANQVQIGPFKVPLGRFERQDLQEFNLNAKSTALNALRVTRGFAANKPIMLEGMPGSGKSSLIGALAKLSGNKLIRLNLSDQTEVSDLFGSDVPITLPNGTVSFEWNDGPVLKAMKEGCWILLDEMNLAPQAILEALNSCFDFRKTLYIAELGRSFSIDTAVPARFFACQNPERMGGNRHALPKSFINRFVTIFTQDLSLEDFKVIVKFVVEKEGLNDKAETFMAIHRLCNDVISVRGGNRVPGAPVEYNLRDLMKMIDCAKKFGILEAFELIYLARLHKLDDKLKFKEKISTEVLHNENLSLSVKLNSANDKVCIQDIAFNNIDTNNFSVLSSQVRLIQKLVICIESGILTLLMGPKSSGKKTMVSFLAQLYQVPLKVISMSSETDSQDLLGAYEHVLDVKTLKKCVDEVVQLSVQHDFTDKVKSIVDTLKMVVTNSERRTLVKLLVKETEGMEVKSRLVDILNEINRATLTFDWLDSEFVKAYSQGEWVLIKDVNCCSAAVLDRLNNCLEREGELVLSEKVDGEFRVLKRHKNFRVFFTMRPENGTISNAMRNRTAEIYISKDECWTSAWLDRLRVLVPNLQPYLLKLRRLDVADNSVLHSDALKCLKTCNLSKEARLNLVGLDGVIEGNQTLKKSIDTFYNVSWFVNMEAFDVNMLCFFARVVSGIDGNLAKILLTDVNNSVSTSQHWNDALALEGRKDWSIIGIGSCENEDNKYLCEHILCVVLAELNKVPSPNSIMAKRSQFEDSQTVTGYLLDIFDSFMVRLKAKELLDKEILYAAYLFVQIMMTEWNPNIVDVIGLEFCKYLHKLCISKDLPEGVFLTKLDELMSMMNVSGNRRQILQYNDIQGFTDFKQVEEARKRYSSLTSHVNDDESWLNSVKTQLTTLNQALSGLAKPNFEFIHLDKFTRMLPYFPVQNDEIMLKFGVLASYRMKILLGHQSRMMTDISQSDSLSPILNGFWKRLKYKQNVSNLTLSDLVGFDQIVQKITKDVTQYSAIEHGIAESARNYFEQFGGDQKVFARIENVQKNVPEEMIDPVLRLHAGKEINLKLAQILKLQYELLKTYSWNILGPYSKSNSLAFDFADDNSSGFSRDLYSMVLSNKKKLEKLQKLGEIIRPSNTNFFELCHVMTIFVNQLEQLLSHGEEVKRDLLHDSISRHVDQITASYWEYPDVLSPYFYSLFDMEIYLALKKPEVSENKMEKLLNNFDWVDQQDVSSLVTAMSQLIASLPARLQVQMINEALFIEKTRPESTVSLILEWLKVQWKGWYDNIRKKQKDLFEYKTTQRKRREENGETVEEDAGVDEEMAQIEQMLPDFSDESQRKFSEEMHEVNSFTESEMLSLIRSVLNKKVEADETAVYCSSLFVNSDELMSSTTANFNTHALNLIKLREDVQTGTTGALNVYKFNDSNLLIDCVSKMQKVEEKVNELLALFPENNILKNIIVSLESFYNTTACHPQMMYTSMLETVLERAELWEANTCREYSLADLLNPLRQVILNWRKMEVVCWSDIIHEAERISHQNALVSSWPLFESFLNSEEDSEDYERKLMVMLIQWLNDSSLNDLNARLESGEMVLLWLRLSNQRSQVTEKINSVLMYYKQFGDTVRQKVKPHLDETKEKLANLVKVAKYTDLNLWSVKDSAQRVHNQLCRLIHGYKVELNKPANSVFLDSVLSLNEDLTTFFSNIEWELALTPGDNNFEHFTVKLNDVLKSAFSSDDGIQLIELGTAFLDQIRENVDYSKAKEQCQENDKEELEKVQLKMYSREIAKRQRTFADLRKKVIAYGFNHRKGITMETDALTEASMTSLKATNSPLLDQLVLASAAARNVVVKLLAAFNHHEKQYVANQISPEMFAFVRGVIEYGQNGFLKLNKAFSDIEQLQVPVETTIAALDDVKESKRTFNYKKLSTVHSELVAYSYILKRKFETFKTVVSSPELGGDGQFSQHYPLFLKSEEDFKKLEVLNKEIEDILSRNVLNEDFEELKTSELNGYVSKIRETTEVMTSKSTDLKELGGSYSNHFVKALEKFNDKANHFIELFDTHDVEVKMVEVKVESYLLKAQSIYRYFERTVEKPVFTKLETLPSLFETIDLNEQTRVVTDLKHQLKLGVIPKNYIVLASTLKGYSTVLKNVYDYLCKGTMMATKFYYDFCCSAEWLLKNGFLNPIPTLEKQSGEGEGETSGEPSGMGEGTGQNDVGKEIEETGQVEGLQDEEATGDDQGNDGDKNEAETPLDMEDDFAADLENLDGEEGEDEKDGKEEEGDEKEPDWDMGDVAEDETKQIDPKLWDEEQKKPENIDNEEQGAQEKTGETVAQAEEASGKESEQDDQQEGDEEESAEKEEEGQEEDAMENVDEICLDEDEHVQNERDNEEMDVDGEQRVVEQPKDEETGEEEVDHDEDNVEDKGSQENSDQQTHDDQQADTVDVNGRGVRDDEAERNQNKEDEEGQEMENKQKGPAGESGLEGVENQAEENEHTDVLEKKNEETAEMSRLNKADDAMEVDEADIVPRNDDDVVKESQKTFAEQENDDQSNNSHYVQKSTTADKAKEMAKHKVKDNITDKAEKEKQSDLSKLKASRDHEHVLDSFYLNTTVDVGKVIRAEGNMDSLKKSLAELQMDGDGKAELEKKWELISSSVSSDAFELAEALRILIEPTKASKFQGDYRTGKRLNMRRLIPYIASNYRKNQIWMRRTKPAKRTIHVCLAIDDSYSMKENMMTESTSQTVCLLEKAFKQLEIGQVSICKFGADVKMLCESAEESNMDQLGPQLLENLKFDQSKTDLSVLLNKMGEFFNYSRQMADASHQLLVVIGDGRGTMVQGTAPVRREVEELVQQGVTTLYLVVDNPTSSVFSMKVASKTSGKMQLSNYMDLFPFPFYTVVQNAAVVPLAVSEAMKQWVDALMM